MTTEENRSINILQQELLKKQSAKQKQELEMIIAKLQKGERMVSWIKIATRIAAASGLATLTFGMRELLKNKNLFDLILLKSHNADWVLYPLIASVSITIAYYFFNRTQKTDKHA